MNCFAKSRSTLDNTHYGWTCIMEADLRNILVNPYMQTDDAGGGDDDKGVSVCSLCEKLTVLETKVLGEDNSIWT